MTTKHIHNELNRTLWPHEMEALVRSLAKRVPDIIFYKCVKDLKSTSNIMGTLSILRERFFSPDCTTLSSTVTPKGVKFVFHVKTNSYEAYTISGAIIKALKGYGA